MMGMHGNQKMQMNHLMRLANKQATNSLLHVKQKQDNLLKGQACADGRPLRKTTDKSEAASSPTAALESTTLTGVVNAVEGRDAATVDIQNAFATADVDEKIIAKVCGKVAELSVQTSVPEIHNKCVAMENGEAVLCVELLKALCGLLKAALLFCKKPAKDLQEQ